MLLGSLASAVTHTWCSESASLAVEMHSSENAVLEPAGGGMFRCIRHIRASRATLSPRVISSQ
jgi:hypothetical protein